MTLIAEPAVLKLTSDQSLDESECLARIAALERVHVTMLVWSSSLPSATATSGSEIWTNPPNLVLSTVGSKAEETADDTDPFQPMTSTKASPPSPRAMYPVPG